mmetsp:Transcript_15398/g.60181  ORF Transcript_15398/g.60181 Transcript_15398/m.60181 type:complete len:365 (-) Transcript_15398:58-1152(-)|eukprot:CAMPEP_0114616618 /NCGR_PEP_ID=MMETSP0168-20121206/6779_1 /TAXON_ID=95228 ORGANISM="Vannella sp., Strain DIVA3 517/6/12" /NCGR_SAMPLE_ID=MMETSP0168 /ASSEMBLY_ACC=CAM_ASM_000044 /LENGTH=364 /DNA_ID=CAMNT_0001827737 /DNA_START=53 /DNA_END=1147 /DNA_ORIENTATION=+
MFGMFKKAVSDAAEKATGLDLDGDGKTSDGGLLGGLGDMVMPASQAQDLDDGFDMPVSDCTGNKKSLFVGINYFGSSAELRGCLNDVENMKAFVTSNYGFSDDPAHMRVLTDDQSGSSSPTRDNIIAGMRWLIEGAQPGDSLFFHYSGHGGTQQDDAPESDEIDGQDETLIPVDYQSNGVIVDDEIHQILVAPLPAAVRLTAVMDCCHSGSIFDLPYSYRVNGSLEVQETDNRKAAIEAALKAGKQLIDGDKLGAAMSAGSAVLSLLGPKSQPSRPVVIRKSLADVIQFSGCKDEQTSADAHIGGQHTGAMSWALITAFEQNGHSQTYTQLLGNIRGLLQSKYTQVPQMSSGHKMNMTNTQFIM